MPASAAALGFLAFVFGADAGCLWPSTHRLERVLSAQPHEYLDLTSLPAAIDWRDVNGVNFASTSVNQHIPHYCGACWAFATVAMLSDRVHIARGPDSKRVTLSAQVILNCNLDNGGCSGGEPDKALEFIYKSGGIPEESCQPYLADGHDTGQTCNAEDVCAACGPSGCAPQGEYDVYSVAEYGWVSGMQAMMAELQRGPLACGIACPAGLLDWSSDEIFEDQTGAMIIDHLITIVGYGTEDGVDYWQVRNSWGTYWGNRGNFRVVRGKNNINIESGCNWAVPSNGGAPVRRRVPEALEAVQQNRLAPSPPPGTGLVRQGPVAAAGLPGQEACRIRWNDWEGIGGERVVNPRPHELLKHEELPPRWDWRNASGQNFATWDVNEALPNYCKSCWAQATASALSDRFSVLRKNVWPQINLSPQVLLNCNGGGSCKGGNPAGVYAYIHRNGITDSTCQIYQGKELACDSIGICTNCCPGNKETVTIWPGTCTAQLHPPTYFISEYGSVRGALPMKAEVYLRGPIGCGLHMTHGFRTYSGGVYLEFLQLPELSHQVSVAGWGRDDDGLEHWVGRNSWGTYWGERGWFRIRMHRHNLGIETDCDFGVPALSWLDDDEELHI